MRNAFKSVKAQDYSYANKAVVEEQAPKSVPLKSDTIQQVEEIEEAEDIVDTTVEQVEETKVVSNKEDVSTSSASSIKKDTVETSIAIAKDVLYAQANALGYQLVDRIPKVVYVLLKSTRENVYFLRNKRGTVYKEKQPMDC